MEAIKVKDLMVPLDKYLTISEDATLFEAVLALEQARKASEGEGYPKRALLVRDKSGKVIGKLGFLNFLRCLEPKYGEFDDLRKLSGFGLSADFLKSMLDKFELWKAPLDRLCEKAADVKVKTVVTAPLENEVIDESASLDRAVHQLIMGHYESLLVTSGGDIVGILRLCDVVDEIFSRIKACKI